MKKLILLFVVTALVGCGQQEPPKENKPAASTQDSKPAQPVMPEYNYVMQDGMKYGYPVAISENQRKEGQMSEQLLMALFAGEKDGKFQVHVIDGVVVRAMECEAPCQYLKVMSYIDDPILRKQIKVEHIAASPGSVGYLMMQDAIRGKLKQYGVGTDKKRYTVWVDEHKGMIRTPMP